MSTIIYVGPKPNEINVYLGDKFLNRKNRIRNVCAWIIVHRWTQYTRRVFGKYYPLLVAAVTGTTEMSKDIILNQQNKI